MASVLAVTQTAAVVATAVLAGLAVLQAGLAAGRPWGRLAWGGQHEVLPPGLRRGSVVSIVIYALFAAVILTAADLVGVLPRGVADVGIWVLTGYFLLGVVTNGISRSRLERAVMTPVSLVLALCCLAIALG
jgi:hypothetical protein